MRARDYQPGELIPGTIYKVVHLIGVGGMGSVYDVEDTTVGKRYVLKTLHPKLGAREDLARRIQKEARILGRLNHPNIVEVFTAGATTDALRLPFYIMERLSGQSLRVVLEKKGRLELSHAYHIGIDLLDALDHAHDKGVIHRDVKPDNIFLHRPMAGLTVTKLLDFGIVSVLDGTSGETAGRFLGTLRYAAPEQLRGEKPTAKTDVYAAALVLYEIVAGRGPFDDEGDAHKIAAAHMHKFPLPVSKFVSVPREFERLLMAGLSKNPEARPRDAFSFAASLRNLQRRLEDGQHRHSVESRVTASAVIEPESVRSLVPTTNAPPTRAVARPSAPPLPPMRSSQTTLVGMPEPTQPPVVGAPASTIRDGNVAAAATTGSFAGDTLRLPVSGTEVLSVAPAPAQPPPGLADPGTEIVWPSRRQPVPSVDPQVRSVLAATPPERARALRLHRRAWAGGAVGLAVALVIVAATRARSIGHSAGTSPAAAAPMEPAEPRVAVPAVPPSAVPATSGSGVPSASAAPVEGPASHPQPEGPPPSPLLPRPAAPHPRPVSAPRPVQSAAPYPSDRPGPGF